MSGSSADESEQEFEEFLYHITHDLRACFRALKAIPQWIEEDLGETALTPQVAMHLRMLITQAQRGDRILLDLREFSRVTRKGGTVEHMSVAKIVTRCWAAMMPPVGMRLDTHAADGHVTMPREDADRLFTALLENAVKHHDRREGIITVRTTDLGERIQVVVEDDGPGIPPELRERAMELLTTLKPRDTVEGSGVGLALARRVVSRSGGVIQLSDGPTGGLQVTFTLPTHVDMTAQDYVGPDAVA